MVQFFSVIGKIVLVAEINHSAHRIKKAPNQWGKRILFKIFDHRGLDDTHEVGLSRSRWGATGDDDLASWHDA